MVKRRQLSDEEKQTLRAMLQREVASGRLYLHEAARRMRDALNMTQPEMARELGIAERTYIDFERNVGNPTLDTMRRVGCMFELEVKFGPIAALHDGGALARSKCEEIRRRRKTPRPRGKGSGPKKS